MKSYKENIFFSHKEKYEDILGEKVILSKSSDVPEWKLTKRLDKAEWYRMLQMIVK